MAVLVVGGAGYIGSHAVKMLQGKNQDVVVFDNLEKGHLEAVGDVPFFKGDLRNKNEIRSVFEKHQVDSVMHFAAYSLVGESMCKPELYYENNIAGTANLLAAMKESGVKHIIFSSTAAVYGEPLDIPIDEKHQVLPSNVYGETKVVVEKMLDWFDKIYGIKSIRLRYFNAAGADPSGQIGELHSPETHLIPIVFSAARGEIPHITICGDNYDTTDGTCVRDYIHVNDLADAHILALDFLRAEGTSDVFNLGNGNGYSVKEIIEVAEKVTGQSIPVKAGPRRPGDPAVLIASSEKIKGVLGWCPRLENIETIIQTAWKWHSTGAGTWKNSNRL